jgi:predicted pyridoxine 5'-phosphate oxidase superfamily flavin-nucleotide-binding protein
VSDSATTPFHAGELELQERAGWRERLAHGAQRFIRERMPDQHREFFAQLPFVVVGMLDEAGRPWAGFLAGPPGFINSPDDRHLEIHATLPASNPLASPLRAGADIGLLGIEFHTRRRNRANGVIVAAADGRFRVRVEQSFGNCKQYIATRVLDWIPARHQAPAERESAALSGRALQLIRASSTLFIASAARAGVGDGDHRDGCDVSHRGGEPGFVQVAQENGATRLWIPDYRGNNFFNTFGNILRHPQAGLVFADFAVGRVLMLTGAARVVWEDARRGLEFAVATGCWQPLELGLKADTGPH